jgi:cysteine-rich repeat protein
MRWMKMYRLMAPFVSCSLMLACSDPVPADPSGSTTNPGETGDGDGDGDGDGPGDGDGDGDAEPFCGDGKLDPLELCDDGNNIDGDGCEADCTLPACPLAWYFEAPETTLSGNSFGRTPIVARDDGTIVTTHEGNGAPGIDIQLRAWTSEGEPLWEVAHSFDTARDRPFAMLNDALGDLYMAASINATNDGRANVVKFSGADGSVVWQYERDGAVAGGFEGAIALDFDSAGRLVAALTVHDDEAGTDVLVLAFDAATGEPQWSASWSGPLGTHGLSNDNAAGLVVDPADDRIYVLANRSAGPAWVEPVLLRFEPPADAPSFAVEFYPEDGPDWDSGEALALTSTGELIAALSIDDTVDAGVLLVGLDKSTGAMTWEVSSSDYGIGFGESYAFPADLIGLPGGGLAAVGWGTGITVAGTMAFVMQFDAEHNFTCLGLFGHEIAGSPLLAGLAATSTGRVYASGYSAGPFRPLLVAWD